MSIFTINHILVKICQYLDLETISKLFRLNKETNAILNDHKQIIFKNILNFCGFYPKSECYLPIIIYINSISGESKKKIIKSLDVIHTWATEYPSWLNFDYNTQDSDGNTYIMYLCTHIFNSESVEDIFCDIYHDKIYNSENYCEYLLNLINDNKLDVFIRNDNGDDVLDILIHNQHLKNFNEIPEEYKVDFIVFLFGIIIKYYSNGHSNYFSHSKLIDFVKKFNVLNEYIFIQRPESLKIFIADDKLFNAICKDIDINATDSAGYTALAYMIKDYNIWEDRIIQILDTMNPDLKNDKFALRTAIRYYYYTEGDNVLIHRLLGFKK